MFYLRPTNLVSWFSSASVENARLIRFWLTESLKVALQILGRKFYENTKISSLYSPSLLVFIHNTPVVERYPKTREIRDLLWPRSTPTGNTVYFTWAGHSFTHWKYTDVASNIAFDEDIMENNYMFVIEFIHVISHWIFPQCFFFFFIIFYFLRQI